MFELLYVCGTSALVLPVAIAFIRGWAPKAAGRRISPGGIRVRGVALLVLWASATVPPLAEWSGRRPEDSAYLVSSAQLGLMMFGAGLMCGSPLGERFNRQAIQSRSPAEAPDGGRQPQGSQSTG